MDDKRAAGQSAINRDDSGAQDGPRVNRVRVQENGPLVVDGPMRFRGGGSALQATLCRCGASTHKPFCDTSHVAAGFSAPGEMPGRASPVPGASDGPLEVIAVENGPLRIKGNLEIVTDSGRTVERVTECWLCRCGGSANKPYCDGTHRRIGFTAPGLAPPRK